MLFDRKRSRQCVVVVPPRAPTNRTPTTATATTTTSGATTTIQPSPGRPLSVSAAQARSARATSHFLAVAPRFADMSHWQQQRRARSGPVPISVATANTTDTTRSTQALSASPSLRYQPSSSTLTTTTTASTIPTAPTLELHNVDVRKVIGQAHRARRLLLDRLTIVNLRRTHRCELVDEIERLKKVLTGLQDQIDTTARNVETMDRLVQHLQKISSIYTESTATVPASVESASSSFSFSSSSSALNGKSVRVALLEESAAAEEESKQDVDHEAVAEKKAVVRTSDAGSDREDDVDMGKAALQCTTS